MAKISFDFIALGEALIDFISRDEVATLGAADYYQRFAGGEPANLARNMSLFGNRVAIGTCVGDDSFGHYIKAQLDKSGIDTSFVQTTLEANTTLVPITRTAGGTPDFMVCRGADAYLKPAQGLMDAAANCRLVHTSAFAISRDPARSTILEALKIARGNNALVSFDPNYHPAIQSDIPEFTSFLKRIYKYVDITKPSLDDCARIFSSELEPSEYAQL
ncbi:MAG: PfkB family carbohydrate kinase, partial [Chloroflexota bacterium]|nr:PfkB family carbohydrate kinase [Chloroflexota bacterium]